MHRWWNWELLEQDLATQEGSQGNWRFAINADGAARYDCHDCAYSAKNINVDLNQYQPKKY